MACTEFLNGMTNQENKQQEVKRNPSDEAEMAIQQLNLFEPILQDEGSPSIISEETMTINLKVPDITELKPKITVFGVGGAGGNAVNNMIKSGLEGVEFVVANTDAQALSSSHSERVVQMGLQVTEGLGAGSQPDIGRQAAEEVIDEINDYLTGSHMAFITAGMGGGTGTGAAPVVARAARDMGILTVGVVTKPFQFEGGRRMRIAEMGIEELQANVDTLIVIPNQNLFRIANEKTTFADAFSMADQVLYSGVACITDLMVKEGLINLDFADVRSVMREMGKAMMGTGEASGENRATEAAEAAIANPLLDETSMQGAQGLLISITGGNDLTLFEVDEAATRIREEVDQDANIILGATFDESLEGIVRVSVVATGIEQGVSQGMPVDAQMDNAKMKAASSFMRSSLSSQSQKKEAGEKDAKAEFDGSLNSLPKTIAAHEIAKPAPQKTDAGKVAPAMTRPATSLTQSSEMGSTPPKVEVAKTDPAVTIAPFTPSAEALKLAESAQKMQIVEEMDEVPSAPNQEEVAPLQQAFVPPVAETPVQQPKMPSVDDFPMIVQEEMRAKSVSALEIDESDERGALGLLKRITTATLGGRKEGETDFQSGVESAVVPQAPVIKQQGNMPRPTSAFAKMAQPAQPSSVASSSSYAAQQPAQHPDAAQAGQLDNQGRVTPASSGDDQLEIPAFLRRQINN